MKRIVPGKFVVNLTNKPCEPAAVSILSKSLNYVQTTSLKYNLKYIISGAEQAIQYLSMEKAEEIREETSRIIRHWTLQKVIFLRWNVMQY
jgi:hypothetical protein